MIIKELNLLIATHILQGHKCNAHNQPLHTVTVTVFLFFLSSLTSPKTIKLFIHNIFGFFSLKKYKHYYMGVP